MLQNTESWVSFSSTPRLVKDIFWQMCRHKNWHVHSLVSDLNSLQTSSTKFQNLMRIRQESLSSHHKIHRRWSNPYRRAKEELLWIEQKCWISYPSSPQRCYLAILHTGWHSCPSRHSCHYVWLKGQEALVMKPQAAFNNQLANRANGKPQFSTSSLLQQYSLHAHEEIKNSFLQPVKVSVGVCCSGGLYPT